MAVPPWTRWVKRLTIAHAVGYVLWLILGRWGASPVVATEMVLVPQQVLDGHLWQLVGYILPLESPLSLFFNALMLWMFGGELESRWGGRRFLTFYFGVAIGGSALLTLLALALPAVGALPVIGPGGLMLGLLVAWGIIYAERQISFFGLIPLKGKHLLLLSLAIDALTAFASQPMAFLIHAFAAMVAALLVVFWRRYGGVFSSLRMAVMRFKARRARRHLRAVDDNDRRYLH